ncbi:IS481 family transposase [Mycolicibacterium conceptionense]|uniref:IS481 family transposase n=1 Tax=Mycolicibacterium conceptionense TaxID=451644 RepID=UPI00096EDA48|nr:IS481 family transposase [Mycolicibacterium conceptionense]
MGHANARLTPRGRQILVERIAGGRPVAHVAAEMGVSRTTAWRWWRRWVESGAAGLEDRSSCAKSHPRRTPEAVERQVLAARQDLRRGPAWIAHHLGLPASTVGKILQRNAVPLLRDLDPLTGAEIRAQRRANSYEHPYPGSMVHVDVKKIGRIPDGGGWRVHGRGNSGPRAKVGYDFIHVVIDDYSRVAYAEIAADEKAETCAAVLLRADIWFSRRGVSIERVLSDNALTYRRSAQFREAVAVIGATQKFIKPHCPWTNGKAERLNRTLATEWAYARPYASNADRKAAFGAWLHHYNTERPHFGIGGVPPITRLAVSAPCISGIRLPLVA